MNDGNFIDTYALQARLQVQRWAVTTLYLLCGLLCVLAAITAYYLARTSSSPNITAGGVAFQQKHGADQQTLEKQHAWIQEWRKRCALVAFMDQVTPYLPDNLAFSRVNYTGPQHLSIEGNAEDLGVVVGFIDCLRSIPSCAQAQLLQVRQLGNENQEVTFQLKVALHG